MVRGEKKDREGKEKERGRERERERGREREKEHNPRPCCLQLKRFPCVTNEMVKWSVSSNEKSDISMNNLSSLAAAFA